MEKHEPQIEVIPNRGANYSASFNQQPWFRSHRFMIFSVVFLVSASISLIYVFSRPAVYRSNAVLLTVASTAIDERSEEADIQHVAIQRQILTGQDLLLETLRRLENSVEKEIGEDFDLTLADLRKMLMVNTVTDTNLVELIAEGYEPELLPLIVNTWIDVYLDAREKEIKQLTGRTTSALEDELKGLEDKISFKRQELDDYRKQYNIASIERDENEALARLKGLNDSLNKASEEEVLTKAKLDAIKKAISRGQAVVPKADAKSLGILQHNAQQLQKKLTELDERFTRDYLALQPKLKAIPDQLSELQKQITALRERGQNIVLSDAEQEYMAAKQTTETIRRQLDEHKRKVTEFTARFARHEALQSDLEGLEELFRETQQRLVKIQAKQMEKYPQFSVVDRAYIPRDPIRPNYFVDAVIALTGSLVLALLSVWIVGYLTKEEKDNAAITLSGIHMYDNNGLDAINNVQSSVKPLPQQQNYTLASPALEEISFDDLRKLYELSNDKGKQLIALLLNGLSLEEVINLQAEHIDFEQQTLTIAGENRRVIPANANIKLLFENSDPCPLWQTGQPVSADDLEAVLMCAVIDSGISHPDDITAESLQHSYIIFLVRQGLRLSDLEQIVGHLSPAKLSGYRVYSPPTQGCTIDKIELLHPAIA